MSVLQAMFLGALQGVTEFLPVSSSGHLAIFKNLLGVSDVGIVFDILLHVGTLVAVFLCFWKDIKRLIIEGIGIIIDFFHNIVVFFKRLAGQKVRYRRIIRSSYRKLVMLIVVSTIPTGIVAILIGDVAEAMEKTLLVPGVALLITGVLLLIANELPEKDKTPKYTSYSNALVVGMVQGLAVIPGISRSGSTIVACLGCGMKKEFAVKYSFLMSIPAIMGAAVLKLKDLGSATAQGGSVPGYILGTIVAAVVGFVAIKYMLVAVRNKKYKGFAYYCFILGTISIITYFVK